MKVYCVKDNQLAKVELHKGGETMWVDLLSPSSEEIEKVEQLLELRVPTREQMREIEFSSRLYKENEAFFLTVNAVQREENGNHKIVHISFILKGNVLVTLRYHEIPAWNSAKWQFPIENAERLLLGLVEMLVYATADMLENINLNIDKLSAKIFAKDKKKKRDLGKILLSMGIEGDINSKVMNSLSSFDMMVTYLKFNLPKQGIDRLEHLNLDTSDLKDHSNFLAQKINFLLDACLGVMHIEQNNIIKIFSIAAVVFLPPTLVASIYGMNFKFIPELSWSLGYPVALTLIILSAIIPYLYFRWKRWI